eukprot:144684_1
MNNLLASFVKELLNIGKITGLPDNVIIALSTLDKKLDTFTEEISPDSIIHTLAGFNISHLNTCGMVRDMQVFVIENDESKLQSTVHSMITRIRNSCTRNKNAQKDALSRLNANNRHRRNNNSSTNNSETCLTNFEDIQLQLNNWESDVFGTNTNTNTNNNNINNSNNNNTNNTNNNISNANTNNNISNTIDSSQNIENKTEEIAQQETAETIEALLSATNNNKQPSKAPPTPEIKYNSTSKTVTEKFKLCKWEQLTFYNKPKQICVIGLGQKYGLTDGMTHKDTVKHTNKIFLVSLGRSSSLSTENYPFIDKDTKNEKGLQLIKIVDEAIVEHIYSEATDAVRQYFEDIFGSIDNDTNENMQSQSDDNNIFTEIMDDGLTNQYNNNIAHIGSKNEYNNNSQELNVLVQKLYGYIGVTET